MREPTQELEIDEAAVLLGDLALFEHDQCPDAANAEPGGDRRLLLDIDLWRNTRAGLTAVRELRITLFG